MAFLARRAGTHLNEAARAALSGCRPYPSTLAIKNPLTRKIARGIAEADWSATLGQIDFDYSIEDCRVGGVPCSIYRTPATKSEAPVIIYVHAGAFVTGTARANAAAVLPTCHLSGCEAIAVDYSLAPEAVYPTQLEEIEAVYLSLIESGRDPGSIALVGDSAGGALAASSIYRWRRLGVPLPAAIALLSPTLEATTTSDTFVSLKGRDPLFSIAGSSSVGECFRLYAGDASVDDPEISPLAGDPAGFPPLLIHVGTREVLLGDAARFAEKARQAGVKASLRVFDGMFHLFHQHWRLDEAKAAHRDIADFVLASTR